MQNGKDKIKMVELFAGIGAQAMALTELGVPYESIVCEIDEKAYKSYCAIHGDTPNLGDITKVEHLPECDLLTYSFPCAPRGTKIKTDCGYKNIEDVIQGDMVLTHNNRYRRVVKTMSRVAKKIYKIKLVGATLRLTENHPLYVFRNNRYEWVPVKELREDDELVYNVVQEIIDVPYSKEYLWLLGRYVSDGHVNKYLHNSTLFAIGMYKVKEFDRNIPNEFIGRFKACESHPSCMQYRIADANFQSVCLQFGNGSTRKHIPQWVLNLPRDKLQSFFDGYMSGDGHTRVIGKVEQIMFTTVSEELFLGLQMIIAKLYGKICIMSVRHDRRKETFNDSYMGQLYLSDRTRDQVLRGDKITVKVKKIEEIKGDIDVFNFEVDEDNSYTTNNVIVHNCQDISNAGKRAGFSEGSGTRSSLLWEVKRLLLDMKGRNVPLPMTLLMENVKALVYDTNIEGFQKFIDFLTSIGYVSEWKVMNAKDYGVPQHRERVFMISRLDGQIFKFPKPCPDGRVLRDVLEDNVQESYFLSEEKIAKYEQHRIRQEENNRGFGWKPTFGDSYSHAITTNYSRQCGNFYIDIKSSNKQGFEQGHVYDGVTLQYNGKARRVIQKEQSPTLMCCVGGGNGVIVPNENNKHNKIKIAGELNLGTTFGQADTVLSTEGVSPTITTCYVGIGQPKIEVVGNLHNHAYSGCQRVYGVNSISPTLQTASGGDYIVKIEHIDKSEIVPNLSDGQVASMLTPGREDKRQCGNGYKTDGNTFTVTCQDRHGIIQNKSGRLRIRYLTPRECWRLQGFPDSAYDSAVAAGISKTALYNQAGNSIAVPCLKAIFKGLYMDNSFVPKKNKLDGWW